MVRRTTLASCIYIRWIPDIHLSKKIKPHWTILQCGFTYVLIFCFCCVIYARFPPYVDFLIPIGIKWYQTKMRKTTFLQGKRALSQEFEPPCFHFKAPAWQELFCAHSAFFCGGRRMDRQGHRLPHCASICSGPLSYAAAVSLAAWTVSSDMGGLPPRNLLIRSGAISITLVTAS